MKPVFTLIGKRALVLSKLLGLGLALATCAHSAGAFAASESEAEAEPRPGRRALSVAAAIVPGALVHGSGHYVAGQASTGSKLLLWEGVGLGAFFAGGVPIYLSGASRYLVGPAAALTVLGFGVFSISFLADLYGTLAEEEGFGDPALTLPRIETELGHRYVYDPQFRYRNFLIEALDFRYQSVRLRASAWHALDDQNSRLRLLFGYRFLGRGPDRDRRVQDGTALDFETAVTSHRYDSDGFSSLTGEVSVNGRLDLRRIDPALRGSFGELGTGVAVQEFDYDVAGLGFGADVETLLLARFAFGIYIGHEPDRRGGELAVYYDHRHDGYAAGLKVTGLGSGVLGHFGLSGKYYLTETWGVGAEAEVGSAYSFGLSALFRYGESP